MMNVLAMTEGAKRVAQTDPHGLTLTLIAVLVVFGCLLILYFIYNLSGNVFSGKFKRTAQTARSGISDGTAAAIAMALEAECGQETEAAIATAICLELGRSVHDAEPGIITIRQNAESAWKNKSLNFRRNLR